MKNKNTDNQKLYSLIENKNFLNHQNYVLWKILYKKAFLWMWSSSKWKNDIWYNKNLRIQKIAVSVIEKSGQESFFTQLFVGLLFTGVWWTILYQKQEVLWLIIMLMGIGVLYLFFVYQRSSSHQIFRNRDDIIFLYYYNNAYYSKSKRKYRI